MRTPLYTALTASAAILTLAWFGFAGADGDVQREETAMEIMQKACDSYAGASNVEIRALISIDTFREADLKVQENSVVTVKGKVPNKFIARSEGDRTGTIVFDGQKLMVVDHKSKFFAETMLQTDQEGLLDLTDKLNIPTPMLDFVHPKFCHHSLTKATESEHLGTLMINDEPVEHLVFRNKKDRIDWQVWVKRQDDGRNVVKKAIITSRYLRNQPQYEFLMISEKLDPGVEDSEFDTSIVAGDAFKVDFLETLGKD